MSPIRCTIRVKWLSSLLYRDAEAGSNRLSPTAIQPEDLKHKMVQNKPIGGDVGTGLTAHATTPDIRARSPFRTQYHFPDSVSGYKS